ncbi:hypothetical protein ACFO5K_08260 [Nocardia halotolerans]|uniref:Uncharacterized protein n=1 Tax=Nocardia halotolerans TaxID=1755878 RepID=A0ABV8VDM8_9NOCA
MQLLIIAPTAAVPAGMEKSGTQTISAGASNVKVTGWTIRAGYEESNIIADELVLADAMTANVRCQIALVSTWNPPSGSLQASLVRNGTALATKSFGNNTALLTFADVPVDLGEGDRIWVQMTNTTSLPYSRDAIVQTGPETYLTVDAA